MYDLIIIGAGPAGLSAAIYAIRKKLNTLVLSGNVGGQVIEAHTIDNYLGIFGLSGAELVEKFHEHARTLGVIIKEGVNVKVLTKAEAESFKIITSQGDFEAKSVIVATGKKYRQLDIPGAKKLERRGITYCATCDAPLFKNKMVAVIGAGDAGLDATWQLTKYASKIYLLNKYPELRGDDIQRQEQLKKSPLVEIFNNCEPREVKGDKFVTSLIFSYNGSGQKKQKEIAVQGIFVEIGSVPILDFLNSLVKLNGRGEIIINPETNASSETGIFAAGDVTNIPHKQMIVAAGEGAKAALSVYNYLKK